MLPTNLLADKRTRNNIITNNIVDEPLETHQKINKRTPELTLN